MKVQDLRVESVALPKTNAPSGGFKALGTGFDEIFKNMQRLETQLGTHKNIEPQQILRYQIQVSRYAMGVELVSKVAESMSATLRKLQGNQ
jgi:type III secretion system YscI/HrpB-like protein